jgi:hypothetical protein
MSLAKTRRFVHLVGDAEDAGEARGRPPAFACVSSFHE